jgi:hypothetical protein
MMRVAYISETKVSKPIKKTAPELLLEEATATAERDMATRKVDLDTMFAPERKQLEELKKTLANLKQHGKR